MQKNCIFLFTNQKPFKKLEPQEFLKNLAVFEHFFCIELSPGWKIHTPRFCEPFLCSNFDSIFSCIGKNHSLNIHTSLVYADVEKLKETQLNPSTFLLKPFFDSFHVDGLKLFGLYAKKANQAVESGFLKQNEKHLFVFHPLSKSFLIEYSKRLRDCGFIIEFVPFFGSFDGCSYPSSYRQNDFEVLYEAACNNNAHNPMECLQEFNLHIQTFIRGLNRIDNYECASGCDFIVVYKDGSVSRCYNYSKDCLGNVVEPKLYTCPTVCNKKSCTTFEALNSGCVLAVNLDLEFVKKNNEWSFNSEHKLL